MSSKDLQETVDVRGRVELGSSTLLIGSVESGHRVDTTDCDPWWILSRRGFHTKGFTSLYANSLQPNLVHFVQSKGVSETMGPHVTLGSSQRTRTDCSVEKVLGRVHYSQNTQCETPFARIQS